MTFVTPHYRGLDFFRWGTFVTLPRTNPVGLPHHIKGMCPPYYNSMANAVQSVVDAKYNAGGAYGDQSYFRRIFEGDRGQLYLKEVPHYKDEVIACVKDICTYIYERHQRFPAHCLDLQYYDTLFKGGYTETQREHQQRWHS